MKTIRKRTGSPRRAHLAAWMMATLVGCGGSGGGDGDGGPVPTECLDISGGWIADESANFSCDGILDAFLPSSASGSGSIEMRQNGCAIAYTVPGSGIERRGTIDGSYIRLSGPIAVVPGLEDVRIIENFLAIEGEVDPAQPDSFRLTGSGALTIQAEGEESSCSVSSGAEFSR